MRTLSAKRQERITGAIMLFLTVTLNKPDLEEHVIEIGRQLAAHFWGYPVF